VEGVEFLEAQKSQEYHKEWIGGRIIQIGVELTKLGRLDEKKREFTGSGCN